MLILVLAFNFWWERFEMTIEKSGTENNKDGLDAAELLSKPAEYKLNKRRIHFKFENVELF